MTTAAERYELALNRIPDVAQQLGTFVDMVGNLAQVIIGDNAVIIPMVGQYPPWPGDAVQLERRNGRLVVTGPAVPKSPVGKITAAGTPRATVLSDGTTYLMPVRDGYTAAVGDDVTINWASRIIEGKVAALDTPTIPTLPGAGDVTAFEHVFRATDSGQFRSRWQSNTVQASDSVSGAWVYGPVINNTIPDAAAISSVEIYLPLIQEMGVCVIGYHGYVALPDGAWTGSTGDVPLAPRSGWVNLPTSFGDFLKVNHGGIAVSSGNGMNRWAGTQQDGLSGALRIRGTA